MKQENTRALFDAITGIDDDLIAEAADTPVQKRRKPYWVAAVAAVLALIVGLGIWFLPNTLPIDPTVGPTLLWNPTASSADPTPIPSMHNTAASTSPATPTAPPPENLITLSAEDIAAVFERVSSGTAGITRYMTFYTKELIVDPIEYKDYLPVYQTSMLEQCKPLLASFIEEIYPLFTDEESSLMPKYNIEEIPDSEDGRNYYIWQVEDGFRFICTDNVLNAYQYALYYEPLQLNGETIRIPYAASDEQIAEILSETIRCINQLLGKDFFLYHVLRMDANEPVIHITLKAGTDSTADIISLDCGMYADDGYYTLYSINYSREIPNLEMCHPIWGYANMITLEEAEELLAKGYTFGYQTCTCGGILSGPELDFSEYDAVELEWVYSNEGQIIVPFYNFYKQTGYDQYRNQKIYARTMVPAIDVDGLEDYFDSLEHNHYPYH